LFGFHRELDRYGLYEYVKQIPRVRYELQDLIELALDPMPIVELGLMQALLHQTLEREQSDLIRFRAERDGESVR
jgi:hypothetical protein